ncbi:MAG: hypothetical protein AAB847_01460 [Patescibacteria group bacterium]
MKLMTIKYAIFIVSGITLSLFITPQVYAATNIDSTDKYAWNDVIGWIDFYITNSVMVRGNKIEGYARSSAIGDISFGCATGPIGSNCIVSYGVTNDFAGHLAGWAWSENIGWISFRSTNDHDPNTAGVQESPFSYGVNIDVGYFSGWAWNDVVGWISFNCSNVTDSCGASNYKVRTSAGTTSQKADLTSSIFDSGTIDGVALNSIMWKGDPQDSATIVEFQIASSNNADGPWTFVGNDQTANSYYRPIGPNIFKEVKGHINKRYFRYKIFLQTDIYQTYSPIVEDVIINYSP